MGLLSRLDPVARAVRKHRDRLRAEAGLDEGRLTLPDGREVAYLDNGGDADGRPVLLAVHGIGAQKDHWPRLARLLAGRVRTVAPDLPGFGDSDRDPAADYSMTAQAEAVVAIADALGLDRVHLAGSSMGGRIAAEVAATRPDRLLSLWLLAPAGAEGERPSEMIETLLEGGDVPLFSRTAQEYRDSVAFTMSQPPEIPKPALRVLAAESARGYDLNLQIFRAMAEELDARPTTEALLDGLAVPTLVTWGEEDRVLHPSGARTIAERVPDVTVRTHPEIGHIPMLEVPDAPARDFLDFLDAHGM
jgi:pimeloyl-ACP methyl ester carboxylesterase